MLKIDGDTRISLLRLEEAEIENCRDYAGQSYQHGYSSIQLHSLLLPRGRKTRHCDQSGPGQTPAGGFTQFNFVFFDRWALFGLGLFGGGSLGLGPVGDFLPELADQQNRRAGNGD